MNVFTVEWSTDAEDQLAALWLNASDPNAITKAQAKADSQLRQSPLGCGAEANEGLRYQIVPPIVVWYSVDTTARSVMVDAVALSV